MTGTIIQETLHLTPLMAFQPLSSSIFKKALKILPSRFRNANANAVDLSSRNVAQEHSICSMSIDPGNVALRQWQPNDRICEFDYQLGRNAFRYFLTDAVYNICKSDTTISFIDTFDSLYESFSYEKCYRHLLAMKWADDKTPTAQEHQVNYRPVLFRQLGSIRRQNQGSGLDNLRGALARFVNDDREEREPKFLVDRSTRGCQAGELVDSPTSSSSSPASSVPTTVSSATAASPTISTPATASVSIVHNDIEDTEDMAAYTMRLKELGDEDNEFVVYEEERVRFEPPLWRCTVNFRYVRGIGEGPKKRTAKHKASKAAWLQLGEPALV